MFTQEAPPRLMTVEEFIALPNDGKRYELVEGALIEKPIVNETHSFISALIATELTNFVRANKLGRVYGAKARYEIVLETPVKKAAIRMPDVSFVRAERVVPGAFTMKFAPDLAVEVLSDSNEYEETELKRLEYFRAGGRLVWVVSPMLQEVYVFEANKKFRTNLELEDELDGGTVLPGFKLPVRTIFDL
jgi:Uma2 family endonuclease